MEELEYIVTLKDKEYLEGFYHDMEAGYAAGNCPARSVSCAAKRPLSRNTHYLLTRNEAEELRTDPRVLAVSPVSLELVAIRPLWEQTSIWNKSSSNTNTHKNWGLYRVTEEENPTGYGSDDLVSITSTINVNASGKNVDVIIIDGHVDPNHPEFALNSDGTGESRVTQLNWFTLNSIVTSIDDDSASLLTSNYVYTPYTGSADLTNNNNHGAHVAGTACGNTQGWARDANIYNINPYASNPNGLVSSLAMWDYIRAFHLTKPINPETGIKNPTICNGSYGSVLIFPYSGEYETGPITDILYRGVESSTSTTFTDEFLTANGIYTSGGVSEVPYFSPSIAADIEDAISDGIIVVGAAGNESFKIDVVDGIDYDNLFIAEYEGIPYAWASNRGTTPSAAADVICVGAVSSFANEEKRESSNCGPRVDIFAPGSNIMSSFNGIGSFGGTTDPRDANFRIGKISGTSMASPQVCGLLACVLELYPRFNQTDARNYLINYAKTGQLTNTSGGPADTTDLQDSENRYIYYYKERLDDGNVYPKSNYAIRPNSGQVWPRPKIYRYGR
jgi:hypothetical protein